MYLSCTVNAHSYQDVFLEWSNQWTSTLANYGLFIRDNNGNLITSNMSGGDNFNPPIDHVQIDNSTSSSAQTYQIAIEWIKGDLTPVDFKIIYPAEDGNGKATGTLSNNYTDNRHIFGHSGYPNVIGVAAYEASSQNAISSYSSSGPLTMYSTDKQTWAPQNTPFITATAGVQTWIGTTINPSDPKGQTYWPTGNPVFSGTSAAAPHIAAIAALYFSAFPANTLENFQNNLKMSADPIGGLGGSGNPWNARAGYGKANALTCLTLAATKVKTPTFDPPPSEFCTGPLSVTITSESGAEIRYTIDGSTPSRSSLLYNGSPANITPTCTLKAIAYLSGKDPSEIQTGIYQLGNWNITGKVTTVDGQPIDGVNILKIHNGSSSGARLAGRITDVNGEYKFAYVDWGDFYDFQLQASKSGYVFSPIISGFYSEKSLNNVQNFTTCKVSGHVYQQLGIGLAGVQVTIEVADLDVRGQYDVMATVTTDSYGYYATYVPPGPTRITPSETGCVFNPVNIVVGTAGAARGQQDPAAYGDKLNQDFYEVPAAPIALDPTNITSTSFTANWGAVSGSTNYYLDVTISDAWNNLLPAYNNLDVSNVTSYPVTGLSPNTPYMYRVRSYNGVQSPNSNYKGARTLASVSGTITYVNTNANPIGNVAVTLTPATGTALTATSSTADGTFNILNVPNGAYTLTASKTGNLGGVSIADALTAVQYFVLTIQDLGILGREAGDVDKSGAVNSTDALLIARRSIGNTTPFPAGDWVFTSAQPITVSNENVINLYIRGRAVGDVDGSYTLPPGTTFQKSSLVQLKSGTDKFEIFASASAAYGAVGMRIKVTSAKVAGITSKLPGFMSRIDDEGVSFGWFAADGKTPVQFEANEAIVTVTLAEKAGNGSSVTVESELVDIQRTELNNNLLVSVQGNIPSVFELKQNYPNPFNPSTQIDYDLPQPGMVTLSIYNIMGQEVAKLVNEQKDAGSYSVPWAPKNLASGVYIYRIHIQTDKETITAVKRLTLLK
jgi:hypothetical protein